MNIEEIEQKFKSRGLEKKWERFKPFLRNSIVVSETPTDETGIKMGQSKIGGCPDLPDGLEWPIWKGKPLSFLAQFNFAEATTFDIERLLPSHGIVSFFYHAKQKTWGIDPKDKGSFRALYHDEPLDQLKRRPSPDILPKSSIFQSCQLSFRSELSIPNYECSLIEGFFTSSEGEKYCEFLEEISENVNSSTKLLGHSDTIQNAMEIECELISRGYSQETTEDFDEDDPRIQNAKADAFHWRLLLQLDSLDNANMMWGDSGQLYFWIRDNDLSNNNFEDVWLMLQCY